MDKQQDSSKKPADNQPQEMEIIPVEAKDTSIVDPNAKTGPFTNPKTLKIGIYVIVFLVAVLGVWGIGSLIVHATAEPLAPTATAVPTIAPTPETLATPSFTTDNEPDGVVREPEVAVVVEPTVSAVVEDRTDYEIYIVQEGDTIFDIAASFGLAAETILWTNWYTLGEMPDAIYPGNEVIIPPDDGAMYQWYDGDGLNGVSSYFSVTPEDIINYPLNNLDPNTIGNWSQPNIAAGTMLFVPGGTRPNVAWAPMRGEEISGNVYLGPGACSGILYGNVGTGSFTWPTDHHFLSGYDYTPPVHNGLDFDGDMGSPLYAADSGVVIFSGWSDRGYGNLIVIDHDGGWQTYYGHIMDGGILVGCGANVLKGEVIAYMGSTGNSTGPHLHFELRQSGAAVNPWAYLQ
jgi:hypothetical protein